MTSSELKSIIMAARAAGAAVIVDVCQAFCALARLGMEWLLQALHDHQVPPTCQHPKPHTSKATSTTILHRSCAASWAMCS